MRLPKFDLETQVQFVTTHVARRRPLFFSRELAQIVVDNSRYWLWHDE